MPLLINAGFDMKLTRPKTNREEAAAFLRDKPTEYELRGFVMPAGYQLLSSQPQTHPDGKQTTICLLCEGQIVYKLKLLERHEPNAYMAHKNATQLIVWRSLEARHNHALNGFAKAMFDQILVDTSIIITDEQQTEDGRRFWMGRISESLSLTSRCVFYVDLNDLDDSMTPKLHRIQNYADLMDNYFYKAWGCDEEYKNKAFVISAID